MNFLHVPILLKVLKPCFPFSGSMRQKIKLFPELLAGITSFQAVYGGMLERIERKRKVHCRIFGLLWSILVAKPVLWPNCLMGPRLPIWFQVILPLFFLCQSSYIIGTCALQITKFSPVLHLGRQAPQAPHMILKSILKLTNSRIIRDESKWSFMINHSFYQLHNREHQIDRHQYNPQQQQQQQPNPVALLSRSSCPWGK